MDRLKMQIALPEPLMPLPVDSTHYVPALQSLPGERDALRNASSEIWERMTPLLHFVGPKTRAEPFKASAIRSWVAKLAGAVDTHPVYLDVTRLDPTFAVAIPDGEVPVLEYIYEASRKRGLRFVPVLWVGESTEEHRRIVGNAALEDGHGVALRYRMRTYVPPGGMSLEEYIATELTALGRDANDADLLVDLEYIDTDDEFDPDGMASLLGEMLGVGPWRSVVLLGTSIPTMMSCIEEGSVGSLDRREWELWSQLQDCDLTRMPTFGDYAIQNPHPPHSGGGPGMRANIRYTTNGKTLVARGQGPFHEEGKEQYRGLCQQLVARAEFAGSAYSWGDGVIDECARGAVAPGAQNVWRGAGTSHHLQAVMEQLARSQAGA
jgi:hypothetical protein